MDNAARLELGLRLWGVASQLAGTTRGDSSSGRRGAEIFDNHKKMWSVRPVTYACDKGCYTLFGSLCLDRGAERTSIGSRYSQFH
jgi:hypothetical protein